MQFMRATCPLRCAESLLLPACASSHGNNELRAWYHEPSTGNLHTRVHVHMQGICVLLLLHTSSWESGAPHLEACLTAAQQQSAHVCNALHVSCIWHQTFKTGTFLGSSLKLPKHHIVNDSRLRNSLASTSVDPSNFCDVAQFLRNFTMQELGLRQQRLKSKTHLIESFCCLTLHQNLYDLQNKASETQCRDCAYCDRNCHRPLVSYAY